MTYINESTVVCGPEYHKIRANTIYLTFNAPQVDEYHRGIYLTYPPSSCSSAPAQSGTLYHASYITNPDPEWILENRIVKDLSSSKSLVLLYRIASYHDGDMARTSKAIGDVLRSVPLGREARCREIGEVNGNAALGGYDCIIWTHDALEALVRAGLADFGNRSVAQVMKESRERAGPKDARSMVGVDVGGFKVIN